MVLCVSLGCGTKPGRQSLSGHVSYDGTPLPYGQIQFDPDTAKGHKGPQGAGEIRDGQYHTNPDYGPVPGPHIVRINGWNRSPDKGMLGPPLVSDYETRIDIPNASAVLDFDIPKKAKKPR